MAEFALKKYNFDKIIFIPAYLPPHKEIEKSLAEHRFNMVKLAISKNPKFELSDIEYKSEGKSYSLIKRMHFPTKWYSRSDKEFIIFLLRPNEWKTSIFGYRYSK